MTQLRNNLSSNRDQNGGPLWNKYRMEYDLRPDGSAKSPSYFCSSSVPLVDTRMINALKSYSVYEDSDIRICLHDQPDASFHDMINLHRKTSYYRPHKHSKNCESYHLLEGQLGVAFFDDNGLLVNHYTLSLGNVVVTRIPVEIVHAIFPLSGIVIFHECKAGPFLPDDDTIYPSWVPAPEDEVLINQYKEYLIQKIQ